MNNTFTYNPQAFGGTEYMGRGWHRHIAPYVPKLNNYLCLIIPGVVPTTEEIHNSDKQLVVWMHNTPQQFDEDKLAILKHPKFMGNIKNFIVPSEEHKRLTLEELPMDPNLIVVIPNAIDPAIYNSSKFSNPKNVKLIHTSSSDRGLDVLLRSTYLIKEDFRLEIYNDFYPDTNHNFNIKDPRIKFYGKTPKATVLEALEESHIHAYPSTYPETFCMSQVEAMSAGLLCVTSDLGALPEVSNGFGIMYPYTTNRLNHADIFAEHLSKAIKDIREGNWNPTEQIEYVNKTYSWEAIKNKWLEFHETL